MIIARNSITVSMERDIAAVYRFYSLALSTTPPSAPTDAEGKAFIEDHTVLPSGWTLVEPTYSGTTTNSLYSVDLTSFSDGDVLWSAVSKSSSYEAAKDAYEESQLAKKTATNYLSSDNTGIMVADLENGAQTPSTATGRNVFIDNDSVDIRDGRTVLASFGTEIQIGRSNQSRAKIDYHSLQLIDKNNSTYFFVSDLRDNTGNATLTFDFTGDGHTTWFFIDIGYVEEITSVEINGVPVPTSDYTVGMYNDEITFNTAPADGDKIAVTFKTSSPHAKAYTFGVRGTGGVGAMSVALGYHTVASAMDSHAEGSATKALAVGSHAECSCTTASGEYSHAEGDYSESRAYASHAEGKLTVASGFASHAEGYHTVTSGLASHASGFGTIAKGKAQTAIGIYNVEDNQDQFAFIIGNGDETNEIRSNAMTVDWSGNERLAGSYYAGSGRGYYLNNGTKDYIGIVSDNGNTYIAGGTYSGTAHSVGATRISAGYSSGTTANESIYVTLPGDGSYLVRHNKLLSTTVSLTMGAATQSATVYKSGGVAHAFISLYKSGNNTPFSSVSSETAIGTLPDGYRPRSNQWAVGVLKTSTAWATATYYTCMLRINGASSTNPGEITIFGNTTQIRASAILSCDIQYMVY